jgi:membrane protease YdiL (CAAX protease family)
MSILSQATTQAATAPSAPDPVGGLELLLLAPFVLAAVAIATRAGVFHRRSIVGPPRLPTGESLGVLLMGFGAGFTIWIAVQTLVLVPVRPTALAPAPSTSPASSAPATQVLPATAPSTQLADIPPARMALASSVPALVAGAFMLLANASLRRDRLLALGLAPSQFRAGVRTGLIGSAIMIPLVYLVASLTTFLWRAIRYDHPTEHALLNLMAQSPSPAVTFVLIASAVVVAPLFEELLFRGHLQTLITYALSRLLREPYTALPSGPYTAPAADLSAPVRLPPTAWMRWASIAVTSLAFAIVHEAWTIPPIFFLSLCVGYAYERTGNLWTVMVMHAAFNTVSTALYLLLPK